MKITKSQLKKIIQEELEKVDEGDYGEGSMARSQLGRTAELAVMIQNMIAAETNLEEWVESKITKAQDYLSSVLNYMRGESLSEEAMSKKQIKKRDKVAKSISTKDLESLLESLERDNEHGMRAICILSAVYGIRVSEIAHMEIKDGVVQVTTLKQNAKNI